MNDLNYNTVITVDHNDEILGYMEKLEAHKKGVLHRAISVFILNSKGEWLLQQRGEDKYHSGSLWSNATCTHPFKGESNLEAAHRRLQEEMGLQTKLSKLFSFQYRVSLDNKLIEHELDHVFVGYTDEIPKINREEVSSFRYISPENLFYEIENHPERFTEWFKLLYKRVFIELEK
jgi:isopentenyl-diphosphate delta-isomerase